MTDAPVLDISVFAEARDAMRDRFGKVISFYLEDTTSYIEKIRSGLGTQNAEAIVPPAHTIKSSSRQLGAIRLSELAKDIELTCRDIVKGNGSLESIPAKFEQLEAAFDETRKVLQINTQ
jgi:HPt (histidine-containing phosphotransfer) domain-containing protein